MSDIFHFIRILLLIASQVLIFDNIDLYDVINPFVYVLYVYWLPFDKNKTSYLFYAFLIGLVIDSFSDTGGVHAASLLLIVHFRPFFLRFSFGNIYYHRSNQKIKSQKLLYLILLIITHHFFVFSLEVFDFTSFFKILKYTLFSSVASVLSCLLLRPIFENLQSE